MKESRNKVMYQVVEKKSAYLDLNIGIKGTEIATKNICDIRIVVTPSLTLKLSHSATKKQFCKKKKKKEKQNLILAMLIKI